MKVIVNKKLISSTILLFCHFYTTAAYDLSFDSYKNKNGSLKQELLRVLRDTFNIDIFIESGTYTGATTQQAVPLFKKIITIELSERLAQRAYTRFKKYSHVHVFQGSSSDIFKHVLPTVDTTNPLLFFLDAHYSGGDTVFDTQEPYKPDSMTAIRKEINAIKTCCIHHCVILIDDIRGFGTTVDNKDYLGCTVYPTVDYLCTKLLAINPQFTFYLLGDMLLAYDKTQHTLNVSPLVKACTISRLFNGYNYTRQEVLDAERQIMHACGAEKQFLKQLCTDMMQYADAEFHHELWYGLICMGEDKFEEAYVHFNKVLEKSYHDPRIYAYRDHAKALSKSND